MKPAHSSHGSNRGFTLIEVMIVVAIVAILASIAVPSYSDYLRRGRVQEAANTLAAARTSMEQFYQDNRSYAAGGACGFAPPAADAFTYACTTGNGGQSYSFSATGSGGLVTGLVYGIDQQNNQTTTCTGCAWNFSGTQTTWVMRKP